MDVRTVDTRRDKQMQAALKNENLRKSDRNQPPFRNPTPNYSTECCFLLFFVGKFLSRQIWNYSIKSIGFTTLSQQI